MLQKKHWLDLDHYCSPLFSKAEVKMYPAGLWLCSTTTGKQSCRETCSSPQIPPQLFPHVITKGASPQSHFYCLPFSKAPFWQAGRLTLNMRSKTSTVLNKIQLIANAKSIPADTQVSLNDSSFSSLGTLQMNDFGQAQSDRI